MWASGTANYRSSWLSNNAGPQSRVWNSVVEGRIPAEQVSARKATQDHVIEFQEGTLLLRDDGCQPSKVQCDLRGCRQRKTSLAFASGSIEWWCMVSTRNADTNSVQAAGRYSQDVKRTRWPGHKYTGPSEAQSFLSSVKKSEDCVMFDAPCCSQTKQLNQKADA